MIAVPHTGNIRTELAEFLLKLQGKENAVIFFSNARPITNNRNIIVEKFLESDCDYLLMIDSDVVPQQNILDMRKNNLDVCSPYICTNKGRNIIPLIMKYEDNGEYSVIPHEENKLYEVDATGTGCIMIHRNVFDKMEKPYFEDLNDDKGFLLQGEDFYFCKKAKEKNIKIYVDTHYKALHYQIFPM